MGLFGFGKKKEEEKAAPTCTCSCDCPAGEAAGEVGVLRHSCPDVLEYCGRALHYSLRA